MLSLVGLGLCDGLDLSLRGKRAVEEAERVYLEGYTSLLRCSVEELESQLGVRITLLSREDVERRAEELLLEPAREQDVVLLVIGDPFGATTHTDLLLRAREANVPTQIVHNASILTAIGSVGLSLYKFGATVSVPFWEKGFEPTSFLEGIAGNRARGLHTLCLLDIKADEGRFMSAAQGAQLLLQACEREGSDALTHETIAIGVARIGWPEQQVVVGTLGELVTCELSGPPQALLIPGKLHAVEEEMVGKSTTK